MEIYQIADVGVALKFPQGIVAVNPPEKSKKSLNPTVILNTYPIPVAGWSSVFTTEPGQNLFLGSGEYEKDGITIRGFSSATELHGKLIQTTSWYVEADGIRVLVLGDIPDSKVIQHELPEYSDMDVFIPLLSETKDTRPNASEIAGIAVGLEVKRVLPIGTNDDIKKKLSKEMGNTERVAGKYVLKKRELSDTETCLVLLD